MDGSAVVRHSVITCIYAPTDKLEAVVLKCLAATTAEFPHDDKYACLDCGTDAIEEYCDAYDWEVIALSNGRPPRMASLIKAALDRVRTDFTWIIEHDTEILPGTRAGLERLLREHSDLAMIDTVTTNRAGAMNYPIVHRPQVPYEPDERLYRARPWTSLNCGIWRTRALRAVDWLAVPEFPDADRVISLQVRARGFDFAIAKDFRCIHHHTQCRRHLPAEQPRVDVVIPTIGEPIAEQAVLAALHQTYPNTRVVLIGDGPQPEAQKLYDLVGAGRKNLIYQETPTHYGYGDGVKKFWINYPNASEFIHFLDSDDWMPPTSIADKMAYLKKVTTAMAVAPTCCMTYEPDGLAVEDFITFGLTQRTLTQFSESGWLHLAAGG